MRMGRARTIEALLGTLGGALRELARVDAHDERVVRRGQSGELGDIGRVLRRVVEDEVARAAGRDDGVGDRDRIDTVAVRALVRAAVLRARHLELHDAELILRAGGRLAEGVVALGHLDGG